VLANRIVPANGDFRRFNPMVRPFNFSAPLELIPETADTLDVEVLENKVAAPAHRSVGIWSRDQVIEAVSKRHMPSDSTANPQAGLTHLTDDTDER
jgi:hypothetical protein